jgi:NAD(P) transhydrogenase subunit alpha
VDGDGALTLDLDDEVLAGTCLVHDGVVRHAPTAEQLGDTPTPPAGDPPPVTAHAAVTVTAESDVEEGA